MRSYVITLLLGHLLIIGIPWAAHAQDQEVGELARQAQNPVADLISVPFQNNTLFDAGLDDDNANVLNIQPVIPIHVGPMILVNRTIIPIIYVSSLTVGLAELPEGDTTSLRTDSEFGLGDINHTTFLSPSAPSQLIWGIGPSLTLDTATDDLLGSGKWSMGPSAVALAMPGPWVLGALVRQLWSFAGDSDRDDVNQFLLQPFINYNLSKGWFLTSAPIITANWDEDSDQRWTVPVGAGLGRLFRIGKQPINLSMQGFYHVESPDLGPDWSLRVTMAFLFPKRRS